jgi:hypothetical protein
VWLLHGPWNQLGVADELAKASGGRRCTTDMERVLSALVANRALAPRSKLYAVAGWPFHLNVIGRRSSTSTSGNVASAAQTNEDR